jgi:hypothetical protein
MSAARSTAEDAARRAEGEIHGYARQRERELVCQRERENG